MKKDIRVKVLSQIEKFPLFERKLLSNNFDIIFDFYTEQTSMTTCEILSVLKGITRLSDELLKRIFKLIDSEFKSLVKINSPDLTVVNVQPKINKKSPEERKAIAKEKQKQRNLKYRLSKRSQDPFFDLKRRIYLFSRRGGNKTNITLEDFFKKFGKNPVCYLTGSPIDLNDLSSFALDHITPKCLGGSNDISNMGLCTIDANTMKSGYTLEQFISVCKQISSFHSEST